MMTLPRHLSRRALACGYCCISMADQDGLVHGGPKRIAAALGITRKNVSPAICELRGARIIRTLGRTSAMRVVVLDPYRRTLTEKLCRTCGLPGWPMCPACKSVSGRRDRAWKEEALRHTIHSIGAATSIEGLALRIAARTGRQLVGDESDGREGVIDVLEDWGVAKEGTASRLRRLRLANQGAAWDD